MQRPETDYVKGARGLLASASGGFPEMMQEDQEIGYVPSLGMIARCLAVAELAIVLTPTLDGEIGQGIGERLPDDSDAITPEGIYDRLSEAEKKRVDRANIIVGLISISQADFTRTIVKQSEDRQERQRNG